MTYFCLRLDAVLAQTKLIILLMVLLLFLFKTILILYKIPTLKVL